MIGYTFGQPANCDGTKRTLTTPPEKLLTNNDEKRKKKKKN